MNMIAPRLQKSPVSANRSAGENHTLRRQCSCGGEIDLTGECAECRQKREVGRLQRMAHPSGAARPLSAGIPPIVRDVLRTPGQPLDTVTRASMEPRFGHDFSNVRVHTGGQAAAAARAVRANAYAVGDDLVFGEGHYAPATAAGNRLLAHELTHVVQQKIGDQGNEQAAEKEANAAADAVHAGARPRISSAAGPALQRQPSTADEDKERDKIVEVSGRTGDLRSRAWQLVWLMLKRYFPEYAPNISGVGYEEKEPGVQVKVTAGVVKGKKVQTATVTVGKAFVEGTSEEKLRTRLMELGHGLLALPAIPDKEAGPGSAAVWKIIHDKFPRKARRLGGSSYDANLPGLRTEFESGDVQAGKVKISWSGPTLYFGKAFLALPSADQETKIGQELKKVDSWCVENARLDSVDLGDDEIKLRIRGLTNSKLVDLKNKVADADVKAFAENLLTFSTPLEQGLQKQMDGTARVVAGNLTVILQPDTRNVAGVRGGDTNYDMPGFSIPPPTLDRAGNVTAFTAPRPFVITIHTRYGPAGDPGANSAYGRGTTASDKEAGGTSLRVHEGSHGQVYLALILGANATSPYPSFTGAVGDTRAVFQQKSNDFARAAAAFRAAITAGRRQATNDVDCVGVTIDQDNATRRLHTTICVP